MRTLPCSSVCSEGADPHRAEKREESDRRGEGEERGAWREIGVHKITHVYQESLQKNTNPVRSDYADIVNKLYHYERVAKVP